MSPARSLAWPLERAGEALAVIVRERGLAPGEVDAPGRPPPAALDDARVFGAWIESAAATLGIDAEPAGIRYADVALLPAAAPALLRLPCAGGFLVLLRGGRQPLLLGPDGTRRRVASERVLELLVEEDPGTRARVERLLEETEVPLAWRARASGALVRAQLAGRRIAGIYRLRTSPATPLVRRLRLAGLSGPFATFVLGHAASYLLLVGAWFLVGQAALTGHLELSLLVAWLLLLATQIPVRMMVSWAQGRLAVGAGSVIKARFLHGALSLEPDEVRVDGAGRLLGRVLESEVVEELALNGGFAGVLATIELGFAAAILAQGAGGATHALLLAAWVGVTAVLGAWFWRRRAAWTHARLRMTHDLVERMVGHLTRLAQERRERWHDGEDRELLGYLELSRALDRAGAWLLGVVPRGWLVVGLIGLAPAFVRGSSSASIAVALGGVLLAYQACFKLVIGLFQLAGAAIAWHEGAPLYRAGGRAEASGLPSVGSAPPSASDVPVLEFERLTFRYGATREPVLQGCDLTIRRGERVLLRGLSGAGKSTLGALVAGIRTPDSGLLLCSGLDRATLGASGWRRRVAIVPQFHENHVLSDTFLFNLLLGRGWPPKASDELDALRVCRDLGLDEVLARMPAGLSQVLGEAGWRLSHGERGRLFLARALLQRSELLVLDESFAAMDPATLTRCLQAVLARAPTVLVLAHP